MALTAVLRAASLPVDPGQTVAAGVHLRNEGTEVLRLRLAVTGPARTYSWVAPDALSVAPGSEAEARIGFTLPRASVPAAGPLPFALTATVEGETTPAATAEGVVEVRPFSSLSATLSEPVSGEGAASGVLHHQLIVGNRGNSPMPSRMRAECDDPAVAVGVEPVAVVVAPEAKVTATVEVRPSRRPLVGKRSTATFRVVVEPEVGTPVTVEGKVPRRPVLAGPLLVAGAILGVVALVAGGLAVGLGGGENGPESDAAAPAGAGAKLAECPAKGHSDSYGARGLSPSEIAKLPDTYTFLHVQPDGCTPSRFNPCEPIHYIQNAAAAPPDVAVNVREAFRRLSQATGMTFVDDGLTDETVRTRAYVPERYGQRWAPILIVWEHFPPEQTTGESQILGNTFVYREKEVNVSARLRFNVDAYNDEFTKTPIQPGFGPPAGSGKGPIGRENITWGRILLHELAHVVGLGHTRDPSSLMYPDAAQQTIRPADFQRADFAGLRYLGREAGCLTTPPLPAE